VKTLAASIHGAGRYRHASRASSAILLLALLAASCAKKDDPGRTITEITSAVERKDADAVADWLSRDYHDLEHESPAAVVARVRQIASGYESLKIRVSRLQVADLGASRRARFRAELSGTPRNVPGLEGFLPRSSAWDFEASLVYEGGRWRLATASWRPAE
jgi:hypothetical protein